MADIRSTGHTVTVSCRENPRAAVESTLRSVHRPGTGKHPFGNGKLPVRGKPRAIMMVIASAAMTAIRRVHMYEEKLRDAEPKTRAVQKQMEETLKNVLYSFGGSFIVVYYNILIRKRQSRQPQFELFISTSILHIANSLGFNHQPYVVRGLITTCWIFIG
jgi:hypothetical protein